MFGKFPELPLLVWFFQLNAAFSDGKKISNSFNLRKETSLTSLYNWDEVIKNLALTEVCVPLTDFLGRAGLF